MLTLKGAMKLLACITQDNDSYVYDTIDMIMAQCALDGKIDAYAINGRHHLLAVIFGLKYAEEKT